jgi:Uma2 family endonuclease
MIVMPVATAFDYLPVIRQLPPGASFRADHVSWEVYEQLLAEFGSAPTTRIYYDQGKLEAASPTGRQERPVQIICSLLATLSDVLDVDIEAYGSTTLRKQSKAKGAEPHDSFYVQHAAQVIGKTDLNLTQEPPPDIIVESDLTSSSLDRFAIYAALGVPEIWRVVNWHIGIWLLTENGYQEAETSGAFPFLSRQALNEFLVKGLNEGERRAARALREWLKERRPPIWSAGRKQDEDQTA